MRRIGLIAASVVGGFVVLTAIAAGILWSQRNTIAQALITNLAGAYGYEPTFERLTIGASGAQIAGLRVQNEAGQPIFSAKRIVLRYSLSALFRGTRRYGLEYVQVDAPHVWLIHNPNGSFNVTPIALPHGPAKKQAPFWLRVHIRDGLVSLLDRYSAYPKARRESLVGITLDANLNPHRRSSYDAKAALSIDRHDYPIIGRGTFDEAAGYESQRWTAAFLPIAQLVDFALPTRALRMTAGALRGLDFRMFGLADAGGILHAHLGGHVFLEGAEIYTAGLQKPLRNAHGEMLLTDDALAVPRLDASIGGVPLHAAGGVYDFSSPILRLGASGAAPLRRLRTLAAAAANRPIGGSLAFRVLALGPADKPLVFAAFSSPRITYERLPITDARGLIAVQGTRLDVVSTSLRYGPLRLSARGSMTLGKRLATTVVATVAGPSDRVPYAAQIVPHMTLRAVAVVTGVDRAVSLDGVMDGANATQRFFAFADVAPNGTGTAGPISVEGPGSESLYARVALDRPAGENAIFLGAHRFTIRPARGPIPALPGLPSKPLPAVDGTLDTHAVALQHGAGLEFLSGDAALESAHVNGIALDRMLAVGDYLRGRIHLVADLKDGAAALRGLRLPLQDGTMEAVASVGGTLKAPRAAMTALLVGGRVAEAPIFGNVQLAYGGGDRLAIVHSAISAGGGLATAEGTVSGIRTGKPAYDLAAEMREADIAVLTRTFGVHLPYPEGSLEADVRVHGAGVQPSVVGDVSIPQGSINALPFRAATAFNGDASHLVTNGGRVVVGSTRLDFGADIGTTRMALAVSSRAVDLADFNDYFPVAETLAGEGSVAANVEVSGNRPSTTGTIALTGIRFLRFPIGNAYAHWSTSGRTIAAAAQVLGAGGRIRLSGTGRLGPAGTLMSIASQTFLDARASVRDFDLGVWLPAAGIKAPILGRIDADAVARGRLPTIALTANANLVGGLVAQIPIERATFAVTASDGTGRIVAADVQIPYLNATASGTFGFKPSAPVDLTMRATSPDAGALAGTITHKQYPYHGALDTVLRATGRLRDLTLDDVADLSAFTYRGFTLPHAHAEVRLEPGVLDVRDGSIAFQRGSAAFAAHVPVAIGGLAFHATAATAASDPPLRPAAPVSGRIEVHGIDLAQFARLLPKGTQLGGTVAGTMTLGGTDAAPLFNGSIALSDASYSSPFETSPLTKGTATLAFAGTRATLVGAHFDVGKGKNPGSLGAHGTLDVPDLRDPLHASSFDVAATAMRAVFDLPKYFTGELDGTLDVGKAPGAQPLIAGNLTISHAQVPAAAIIAQAFAKRPAGAKPPPLGLDLHLGVGPDVRVQGAGIDVGAQGALALTGTLASPNISGSVASTGGTVNLYRDFTIDRGLVSFAGTGIIPNLDVVATTYLTHPPTDVRLHVTGPATDMNLALTSNPPYTKAQIIGLMIGGPGFAGLNGLQTAQATPPPFLEGIGQDFVNGLFSKTFLEPLQSSLATTLGLQNVQFNYDIAGAGGFSALIRKGISKNLSLLFATTYGFPSRTTVGLNDRLGPGSDVRLTFFSTYGQEGLGYYAPYLTNQPGTNISLQAQQPQAGQQGFAVHYVRHFGK